MASLQQRLRNFFGGDSGPEIQTLSDAYAAGITAGTLIQFAEHLATGMLTTGQETILRLLATQSVGASASGQVRLSYFTARKSETWTQVKLSTGGTAAAATPTLCRVGLYSVAANGDLTLVASIANDTTLFAATNTMYTRSFSASYAVTAGQRYAWGIIVVTAVALPTFVSLAPPGALSADMLLAPRISGQQGGQTDLPNSIVNASVAASAQVNYIVGLP